MAKGKPISEEIKNSIRKEYYERKTTVDELAAKYGVHRRRIYDYVKADRHSAYSFSRVRKMTYLSRDEAELILLMLLECNSIIVKGKDRDIAKVLEEKMLAMADAMTVL